MTKLDIVGITEAAAMLGVEMKTFYNWRVRGLVPKPDAELSMGPVWRTSTIERWAKGPGRQRVLKLQRV